MNNLEKKVFEMYDRIHLGNNEECNQCKKIGKNKLAGPISFFHIGSDFEKDKYKIVFVGKNNWYNKEGYKEEKVKGKFFADARQTGIESLEGKENKGSHYWKRIRDIIENKKVYGNLNEGIKNIAVTNLVKCNTGGKDNNSQDVTPEDIIKSCFELCVFENEIKKLKPKHIIFFTGEYYDEYIKNFNFRYSKNRIKDVKNYKRKYKRIKFIWWERNFYSKNGNIELKILRTYHPERKPNPEKFVKKVIEWVKNN